MPESLFASDYSPVSPATTPGYDGLLSSGGPQVTRSSPLRQSKFAPNGEYVEKHDTAKTLVDQYTGLPTPPRSPPTVSEAPPLDRASSDESAVSYGSGSASGSGSGSGSASGSGTVRSVNQSDSSMSNATLLDLSVDPLDKPYLAGGSSRKKHAGYNSYEGCMEGE